MGKTSENKEVMGKTSENKEVVRVRKIGCHLYDAIEVAST